MMNLPIISGSRSGPRSVSLEVYRSSFERYRKAQSYLYGLIDETAGRWLGRPVGPAVSGRDLSCSLCRIVC